MRTMDLKCYCLMAILVLSAALCVIPQAHALIVTNVEEEISDYFQIPCTGDIVAVSGTMHVVISVTPKKDDAYHIKIHSNFQGVKGEVILPESSPFLGFKYRANETLNNSQTLNKGGTITEVLSFNLIGQGKAPNLKVKSLMHITMNANGEITAFVSKASATCK